MTDREIEIAIAHLLEEDHVITIAVVIIIKTDDHDHVTGGDREKNMNELKTALSLNSVTFWLNYYSMTHTYDS